ncbi:MAG: hypothetical protein D6707_02040 [Bacteroidetes bacterium]|nr:MAG: hypothetical protein D6707_02040 [Bacteroidota bacterium]
MTRLGKKFKDNIEQRQFDASKHFSGLEAMLNEKDDKKGFLIFFKNHKTLGLILLLLLTATGAYFFSSSEKNIPESLPQKTLLNISDNNLSKTTKQNNPSEDNPFSQSASSEIDSKNVETKISLKSSSRIVAPKNHNPVPNMVKENYMANVPTPALPSENTTEIPFETLITMPLLSSSVNFNYLTGISEREKTKFHSPPTYWYAGMHTGLSASLKKIVPGNLSREYLTRRKEEENLRITPTAMLEIGILKNHWTFSSGITYFTNGENINYSNKFHEWLKQQVQDWEIKKWNEQRVDTINYTYYTVQGAWVSQDTVITYWDDATQSYIQDTISTQVYVTQNIDTINITKIDTNFVTHTDSIEVIKIDSTLLIFSKDDSASLSTRNFYSYVEIPLMIGYELPFKQFVFHIQTGTSVAILTRYEAKYLKTDQSDIITLASNQTRNVTWNWILNTGVGYALNEQITICSGVNLRMGLNSAVKNTGFKQRYKNVALTFGIRYKL